MSDDLSREEIHAAVDRAVAGLLDDAGVQQPPVDAVALAQRHLGLVLKLKPDQELEQHQLVAAQEIGRVGKADLLDRLGLEPEQRRGLQGATLVNLFADRLLVPTPWLRDEGRASGWDLVALKVGFATASYELIANRLLDLDEPCVITIVDNDRVVQRRSNAWRVGRELSPAEQECLDQVRRYSRPCRRQGDGWTVQGWPVHAVDWKREILRSVRDDE